MKNIRFILVILLLLALSACSAAPVTPAATPTLAAAGGANPPGGLTSPAVTETAIPGIASGQVELPDTGVVDPCKLVTAAQASQALGEKISEPSVRTETTEPLATCGYSSGDRSVVVVSGAFPSPAQATSYYTQTVSDVQGDATFMTVNGLGDQGFSVENVATFQKGKYVITIQVIYDLNPAAPVNQQKALALAQQAARRMP